MTQPTLLDWEHAVKDSYFRTVGPEEFESKATAKRVTQVASYLMDLGYNIEYLSDAENTTESRIVQLLLDFASFSDEEEDLHIYRLERR